MLLRRSAGAGVFAFGALGILMLNPQFTSGQPGGGNFGKGGGGREFKFGQPPSGGFGQPQAGGGFGKGDFGKGGQPQAGGKNPFTDPDTVFNFYAKGGDVIDFSRMDPNMKAFARRGFEKAGLPPPTDATVITKAQFTESFTRALATKGMTPGGPTSPQPGSTAAMPYDRNRSFGGSPPSYGGSSPMGYGGQSYGGNTSFGTPGAGNTGGNFEREKMSAPSTFRMTDQDIERRFQESDANKDGKLAFDEISDRSPLKTAFQESDANKDGSIDMTEYKAYIAVRFGGEGSDPNAGSYGSYAGNGNYGQNRDPRGDRKEEQPVVAIRYGKLPTGLPSWWDSLDGDKDGQVGLYEWRQDGRDIKEFQKMDLDHDGVLAPQEWQRFNVQSAEQAKAIAAQEEIGSGSTSGSSRPGFGTSGSRSGWPPSGTSGGKDKGSEKERNPDKDSKNPFRTGGGKK